MGEIFSTSLRPRFRDMDAFNHVNNAVYVTYLEIARVEWFIQLGLRKHPIDLQIILARVEIDYIKAIEFENEIAIEMWVTRIGNKSWTFEYEIKEKLSGEILCRAVTVQVAYDYETKETRTIPDNLRIILKQYQRE